MQCEECGQWAQRACAGHERGWFMCEVCTNDHVALHCEVAKVGLHILQNNKMGIFLKHV